MEDGHFYFLKDQYFLDFPDPDLTRNKLMINNKPHDRPCFCAFCDKATGLYWMIPISSQIAKFRSIYTQKVQRKGYCDTLEFGYVLGHEKAFLIQNMCPVSPQYINNEYIDPQNGQAVRVDGPTEQKLFQKARKILALQRQGKKLIFPNVMKIEVELLKQLTAASQQEQK